MQHSVKYIGDTYENISTMRKDKNQFKANDFIHFAKENKNKYKIIENGDDLLVSSWFSNSLINDYISTINNVN